jgi:hypothetical protein
MRGRCTLGFSQDMLRPEAESPRCRCETGTLYSNVSLLMSRQRQGDLKPLLSLSQPRHSCRVDKSKVLADIFPC